MQYKITFSIEISLFKYLNILVIILLTNNKDILIKKII